MGLLKIFGNKKIIVIDVISLYEALGVKGDVSPRTQLQILRRLTRFADRESINMIAILCGKPLHKAPNKKKFDNILVLYSTSKEKHHKFVAKIASDIHKPNGFTQVNADEIESFLDPLPVTRLWGVGRVGNRKLAALQLRTIGDIRRYDRGVLIEKFGSWGEHLWKLANGIDPRKVVPDRTAKQLGHERTFSHDIEDPEMMRAIISHLSEQVTRRLRRNARFARCVTVKYRCDDFRTFAKTRSFTQPTQGTDRVFRTAMMLLQELAIDHPKPIRLLGVSLGNLTDKGSVQLDLFPSADDDESQKAVDQVVDQLSEQLGKDSVYRAASHSWIKRPEHPDT